MAKAGKFLFAAAIGAAAAAAGYLAYAKREELRDLSDSIVSRFVPVEEDGVYEADLDGDGEVDAVAADTTGDGKIDTIAVDTDGDGKLDTACVDVDGDGTPDIEVKLDEGIPTEEEKPAEE